MAPSVDEIPLECQCKSHSESPIRVRQTQSALHPLAQRNAFRGRDAHQQSRSFARQSRTL